MPSEKRIAVSAPCTLSNLGPGFDVFGLALEEPFDVIEARVTGEVGVMIDDISGPGTDSISRDSRENSASVAAAEVLRKGDADFGLSMTIEKGIRPCSGIGSSGASAAAGAYAANLLLSEPLPIMEMIACAARGEEAVCGGMHADNVAPAILGGFTLISSYDPLDVVRITPPSNLGIVVSMPDIEVPTKDAREVLPDRVSLQDMIFHVGQASTLTLGVRNGDIDMIGRSMRDRVVEPVREPMNPHLREAKEMAIEKGASGAFLGGSGPCVIAVYDSDFVDGRGISDALCSLYEDHGIKCHSWITSWGEGCRRMN